MPADNSISPLSVRKEALASPVERMAFLQMSSREEVVPEWQQGQSDLSHGAFLPGDVSSLVLAM